MILTKETMENFLIDHSGRAMQENYEWRWKFINTEGTWSEQIMQQVIQYLDELKGAQKTITPEKLHVIPIDNKVILEVNGVNNIATYCYTETPNTVPSSWKQYITHSSSRFPDELPVLIDSEIYELKDVPETMGISDGTSWVNLQKKYRIEREFLYETEKVIYCVRMVRESEEANTMSESYVTTTPVKYEFDMKCKKVEGQYDIESLLDHSMTFIQMITDQNIILTKQEQELVLSEYDELINKEVKFGKRRDNQKEPHYFLTPKPITLEQIHLIQPGPDSYGINSIWSGYAVTDKADGERMLMYINKDGHAFLINNVFQVFDTGLKTKTKQLFETLLDGEFIKVSERRDGGKMDMFAAFDVYYVEGKSVMNLPLIQKSETSKSRNSLLQNSCDNKLWDLADAQIELRAKEHIVADGDTMRDACRLLLQGGKNLPYHIDGLIFTPANLSVFGYYPDKPVPIPDNVRWDRVLKWKPEEQNTIDFLVEKGQERYDPITKQVLLEFKLYTGYNASQWEPITPLEGIRLRYDYAYAKSKSVVGEVYRAKLFKPISYYEEGVDTAWIPVNINGSCYASDGSLIDSKTIVEFAYNPDPTLPVSLRWKPLRVRTDKTRIFQKTGKLSKTANDLSVATSIWRSIHKPVTKEMLMDSNISPSSIPDTLEERLLGTDDVYYAREIPRQHMLSVHMLNFHNQGIKKMLYEKPYKKDALLELACGMAGDLPRWRDGGYRFIMGVDLVKDNITNPRDGSYARMLRQRHAIKRIENGVEQTIYPDTVFVVGDCAKPLDTGAAADGIDEESKKILQILYRGIGANAPYYKYITRRASKGFNIVSCMFAVHYFFKNKDTLNGFLRNVSYNLRKDGIFIATFMDGNKVHEMLSESSTGVVEGRKLNNTVPVWAIIQRYNKNEWESGDYYGKTVEVFLENTNRTIPEYIVSLDHLTYMARMHGLVLQETALFSETYQKLYDSLPEDPTKRTRLDEDIIALSNDEVQKRFSFLNRWVVFKKI